MKIEEEMHEDEEERNRKIEREKSRRRKERRREGTGRNIHYTEDGSWLTTSM